MTMTYGPDNTLMILLPEDMNPELLNITIDGVRYDDFEIDNGAIDLDISKLKKGNYTVYVEYKGDNKYYPYNTTANLTVDYEIICPLYVVDADTFIYLYLPSEANGNLTLKVNGTVFKSQKLKNGYAKITLEDLVPGDYDFEVFYDGLDFEVTGENETLTIEPELMYEMDIEAGDKDTITLIASKNTKGYALFNVSGKIHNVTIKNGRASYTVSGLAVGEYEFEVTYVGANGFNATMYAFVYVDYATPKIKPLTKAVYATQKTKYKFKFYGRDAKPIKNKYVKVKVAKRPIRSKQTPKVLQH